MGQKPAAKMSLENRAKQFMPFAALKGLEEALASRETIIVGKLPLTEDAAEDLNAKMHALSVGQMITVIYYTKGQYIKKTGLVTKLDKVGLILQVVDTRIRFADIQSLEFDSFKRS